MRKRLNRIQIPCKCGCGTLICNYGSDRRLRQFARHHQHTGQFNPRWKGGSILSWSGYKLIRAVNHPFADYRGYVREHRLIWEKYHKATLLPWTDVHHVNGNRLDNRIGNLMAMTHKNHALMHPKLHDVDGKFYSIPDTA